MSRVSVASCIVKSGVVFDGLGHVFELRKATSNIHPLSAVTGSWLRPTVVHQATLGDLSETARHRGLAFILHQK